MKKLFLVLAVAALASCNSGTEEAAATADTTVVAPAVEAAPAVVDTTAAAVADTAAMPK